MSRHVAVCLLVLLAASVSTAVTQDATRVQELIAQLKNKDEAVRLKAAKELGKLKEKAKDAIPALTIAASKDEDEDVRAVAKKSLEAIKDAVGQGDKDKLNEVLVPLIKDLKGKSAEKRIAALDKLADLGTKAWDAGPDVVEFGILKAPPAVQEAATATLEKIDPEAYKPIVTLIVDKSELNKVEAIERLGALGRKGKSAMPLLKQLYVQLVNNDPFVGRAAATLHAMTKIAPDDKVVIDTVLDLVSRPVHPQRRTSPRQLLVQPTFNLPPRSIAIELLRELEIENKKKVTALIAALNDPECRVLAATELGKLGADAKDAVPVLTKLKLDSDRAVRDAAAAAIELIKQ
jgi:HEAT repeat protein